MLTINVAVILAIIIVLLLFRPVKPRKRIDAVILVILSVILGVLIAPTSLGRGIYDLMYQISGGISGYHW